MTYDDVQNLCPIPLSEVSAFDAYLLVENHSESKEDTETILNAWLVAKIKAGDSSKLQRYELENVGIRDDDFRLMPSLEGDWVKWEDVEKLLRSYDIYDEGAK